MTAESDNSNVGAVAVDATQQREFGWFVDTSSAVFVHARVPRAAMSGCVVLIMGPIGIESQGAAATLNTLSNMLCDSGHVAIEFDPPGTANSVGECPSGPVWEDWIDATVALLSSARSCWPQRPVVVVSLQLSTAVALAAIERSRALGHPTSGLVAWAPTINGKRFLRALKMFGAVSLAADNPAKDNGEVTDLGGSENPRSIESGGYVFGVDLQEAIERINLVSSGAPAVESVRIIDRDDIASAGPWVNQLRKVTETTNPRLEVIADELRGTRDARFEDPEKGIVPLEICSAIVDWVGSRSLEPTASPELRAPQHLPLVSSVALADNGHEITETVEVVPVPANATFDAASILTISSRPATTNRLDPQRSVVITPTGANTVSGPGRLNATLARRLAGDGHVVVRYDRRGVGGSVGKFRNPPTVSPVIAISAEAYCSEHLHDLEFVVRHLATQTRQDLDLIGTCSGATLAYRFVLSGRCVLRVRNLVTINQILWDNEVVDLSQESSLVDAKVTGKLFAAVKSPLSWPELVHTDLHIRRNVLRVARHAVSSVKFHWRSRSDERSAFDRLAASGVHMTQVFDREEVGLHFLRETHRVEIERLRRRGVLESWTIEGAGHTFGSRWSRRWLVERVAALLLGDESAQN